MKHNKSAQIQYSDFLEEKDLILKKLKSRKRLTVMDQGIELFVISVPSSTMDSMYQVDKLLDSVGKKIFIEYFGVFQRYDNAEDYLPAKFSIHSRRNRSNAAKKIFEEGLEIQALERVLESYRLDLDTKSKAEKLYKKLGYEVSESDVKIGAMAYHIIPLILKSGYFNNELELYCDKEYSKEVFGIYFPLLQEIEFKNDIARKKSDQNKYTRYYSEKLVVGNNEYLLCSQWIEKLHLEKLEDWIINKCNSIYQKEYEKDKYIDPSEVFYQYLEYLTPTLKTKVLEITI